jgi:hypothetical protein
MTKIKKGEQDKETSTKQHTLLSNNYPAKQEG